MDLWVAQCPEVDVASQGATEEEALANLREALELYFEPPTPARVPEVREVEVELWALFDDRVALLAVGFMGDVGERV